MNIVLAISVFLLSTFFGVYKSSRINKRNVALRQINTMLEKMITYIEYESMKTLDIIRNLSDTKDLSELIFLNKCLEYLLKGKSFRYSWEESLNISRDDLPLEDDDYACLMSISTSLGAIDAKAQLVSIKLAQALCNEQIAKSSIQVAQKGKLYSSMGVLSGIAFAILVL